MKSQIESTSSPQLPVGRESSVIFACDEGFEVRPPIARLSRGEVVFELHAPTFVLRRSSAIRDLRIVLDERLVYSGQSVVTDLVDGGSTTTIAANLQDEGWLDVCGLARVGDEHDFSRHFASFRDHAQTYFHLLPKFKLAVVDLQNVLTDLRAWLLQMELGIESLAKSDGPAQDRRLLEDLDEPVSSLLTSPFERFEETLAGVPQDLRAAYSIHAKRHLHPLVLCAPFMYRTFAKPLGYAGDYEMVNMMVRDPFEGRSAYARLLNSFFLKTPPVVAHRHRIDSLVQLLTHQALRAVRFKRPLRVLNLGCGPAKEIQDFLAQSDLSDRVEFTLLDFNDETIAYTSNLLNEIKRRHHRRTSIQVVKKSVNQLLKEAARLGPNSGEAQYDLLYCAGLFDYLPAQVCRRLVSIFYAMVTPGGTVVVTNVDACNPSRGWMEFAVDWFLFYRNHKELADFRPVEAQDDSWRVWAESSGVNIFLEIRKPSS